MEKKSPGMDWFGSPFFHQLSASPSAKTSETFINQLIQHLHPAPGSRILDSACGLGLCSRQLAARGFEVTGVDAFSDNIVQAKSTDLENPDFYFHDLRLPFWGNYFQVALNLFDGFGYYRTRREHDNALRTIAASLKADGLLVIDYPNLHYTETSWTGEETQQSGDTRYIRQYRQTDGYFLETITVSDPSLPQPQEFLLQRTKFSLGDFTDMLSFQGMQVQDVFGNYDLSAYDLHKSPRLIVIAKK